MLDKLKSVESEFRPKIHKGLYFNSKNAYVNVGKGLNNINNFTVVAFIKIPDYSSINLGYGIITLGKGTNIDGFRMRVDRSKKLWLLMADKGRFAIYISNSVIPLHRFVFVAAVGVPGKYVKLMVDDSITVISTSRKMSHPSGDTLIASSWNSTIELFKGIIPYIRVYDRALSDAELKHLHINPFDPLDKDHLVLNLTPASIDMANGKWWDLSGKGNHGTIYNATEVKLIKSEVSVR